MPTGGSEPLQKGIYAALGGNSGLTVTINSTPTQVQIYDEPPAGAAFPFITLGDDELHDHGTRDTDGFTGFFKLEIWSQNERGRSTIKLISDAIYAALHRNLFSVTGFNMIVCRFSEMPASDTPDGISWHTSMKFSFIMQAT